MSDCEERATEPTSPRQILVTISRWIKHFRIFNFFLLKSANVLFFKCYSKAKLLGSGDILELFKLEPKISSDPIEPRNPIIKAETYRQIPQTNTTASTPGPSPLIRTKTCKNNKNGIIMKTRKQAIIRLILTVNLLS